MIIGPSRSNIPARELIVIHIAIGTKAQLIKMSPIIQRLEASGTPYRLIDLGQHAETTQKLRAELGIREPDVKLSNSGNVTQLSQGIVWMLRLALKGLKRKTLRAEVFADTDGYCLIHGDTASTLLALWLAKCAGIKVVHVEAGLRSHRLLQPFPEELIRILVMHGSDLLFAPSHWAFANLQEMGLGERSVQLSANTSLEACRYSQAKQIETGLGSEPYALVTTHRLENIFSRERLQLLIETLEQIAKTMRVVFVQHPPTIQRIEALGLRQSFDAVPGIHFLEIVSHGHFISLLHGASFVISDGGSIQEECYYLDKPCLLLRNVTERLEGLGENAVLGDFDRPTIERFLQSWPSLRRKTPVPDGASPALEILRALQVGSLVH